MDFDDAGDSTQLVELILAQAIDERRDKTPFTGLVIGTAAPGLLDHSPAP